MNEELTKEEINVKEYYPIYKIGDIVMTLDKSRIIVITNIRKCYYEYIELREHSVHTVSGEKLTWKKGVSSSSPIVTVNRYYALFEFN